MTYKQQLLNLMNKNNGYVTNKMVKDNNIPTIYLTRLLNTNTINRVSRGIYVIPSLLKDEFFILSLQYNRVVYSDRTALYLNNMLNRSITKIEGNFPIDYNTNKIIGLKPNRVVDPIYKTGISLVETPYGNKVKSYNKERCICNLFISSNYDTDEIKFAIDIFRKSKIDYEKLYTYAKALNVYDEVHNIFEVI